MTSRCKSAITLALALLFGVALSTVPAAATTPFPVSSPAAAAAASSPSSKPEVAVDRQGKLVKHGTQVRVTGTYTCAGQAVDLGVRLDQRSHAKGAARVRNLRCAAGERGVHRWHAIVPATQNRGLFLSGTVSVDLQLCPIGSAFVIIDLHAIIILL